MRRLGGIALIIIALSSGGIGIAMLGGGLAVPGFLVLGFGIYLFVTSFNKKEENESKSEDEEILGKKNLGQLFLGILILIFGIINLVNASLIMVSVIAILIGGGLIYYNLSSSQEEEPEVEKKKTKKKKKKKSKDSGSGYGTLLFFVLFGFLAVIIYQSMYSETGQQKKIQKKEQVKNWRADGVYKDELSMCKGYIKSKYPKKKFTQFNWEKYTADKNKKIYTKKIKMWMKYDGLIRKNKTFKYVDCHMQVNANQTITFLGISDKYK